MGPQAVELRLRPPELRTQDYGLNTADHNLWTRDCGPGIVGPGPRALDYGRATVGAWECGPRGMDCAVADTKPRTAGLRAQPCGPQIVDLRYCGRWTATPGLRPHRRGPKDADPTLWTCDCGRNIVP